MALRNSGRERPITFDVSPSILEIKGELLPSRVKPPATFRGSPVAT
jgi:hypothetical protein